VIDPATIHEVIEGLNGRGVTINGSSTATGPEEMAGSIELNDHDHQHRPSSSHPFEPHHHQQRSLSRSDVFKRIEEDRERHKRLRERRWVQPLFKA
jgi:CTD kinase subunit gamma